MMSMMSTAEYAVVPARGRPRQRQRQRSHQTSDASRVLLEALGVTRPGKPPRAVRKALLRALYLLLGVALLLYGRSL